MKEDLLRIQWPHFDKLKLGNTKRINTRYITTSHISLHTYVFHVPTTPSLNTYTPNEVVATPIHWFQVSGLRCKSKLER